MGVGDWASRTVARVRTEGAVGARLALQDLHHGLWRTLGWHLPRGTNVYDREWDTLVVLDACRVDALAAAADEYDFLGEVGALDSVGSMTEEWQAKTFTESYDDEVARTAYVTANPFSNDLDREAFGALAEVWRYGWDERLGVVPPRAVTDRAIAEAPLVDPPVDRGVFEHRLGL